MSRKTLGRYELVRVLGKGAMGLVYEGRDPNLDRRVAIKTIKVENLSAEEAAEYEVRFRTEARSAARLQHPNIVSVYDSDRDGDIAYLVMEYIQGKDLKHHLDQGERYTLQQAVGIMQDLLAALDYAHQQAIVHRDIKPANLLIEASGRIKLTDFGVARIQDSGEATRTKGTMVGTLKYMSPEQVHGLPIDARSDLFSAGIVLYQLLTGTRPFDGTGDYEIIQKIVGQDVAPPSTLNPQLPPAIDEVVARALQKSREDRYPDAQAFNAALQAAAGLAPDPTIIPPRSTPRSRDSSTWTSTMIRGESLVNTNAGGGTSGLPGSVVAQEVELLYWKEIKDSVDVEEFRDFLLKFPLGIYADLARRRIKRLQHPDGEPGGSRSATGTRTVAAPSGTDDPTVQVPRAGQADDLEATRLLPPRMGAATPADKQRVWLWGGAGTLVLAALLLVGYGVSRPSPPTAGPPPQAETKPGPAPGKVPPVQRAESKPKAAPKTTAAAPVPASPKPPAASPPKAATARTTGTGPEQACEGRVLFGYLNCIREQCEKPGNRQHPTCVERREMERSNQPQF